MSIFNNNDYKITGTGLTQQQADLIYLHKNGGTDSSSTLTGFNNDLTITGNINVNNKAISPIELSQLDGINTAQTIQQQINGIGGGSALLSSNNIWSGTQTFNNNILVNGGTVVSPIEISYLDNLSSNAQNQINSTNNNISTINSTLTTNGITSSTSVVETLNYLQSQINNLPNGSGSGASYFLTDTTSSINNQYKTISSIPANSTNQILTSGVITSSSGNVLMGQFITDTQLNITSIPAGIWDFNMYCNLTNNNLSSYLIIEVYKYSSGISTLLFTMTGDDINSANIIPYNINSTQTAYTVLSTDYLMIKIYGRTTSAQNVTINIDYNSSNYYSHFHLPAIERQNHNDLLNIQGGTTNQYNHLTNAQLNNISGAATSSSNGYLSNTDWSTFNSKQNLILQNTAFNKNYETSTSNIKINGAVNVGTLDTIARADHVHPVDTSREPAITAGTTSQYFRGDKTFQTLDKAAVGLSNVVNKDFSQGLNGIIYINGLTGNDSNDGLSLINAYKTISAALSNTYINSGYQVMIYPATYNENITINQNNLSICGPNLEVGGIININGNITVTSSSTSIRLSSLTFKDLIISGSSNVYLNNCNTSGNLSKSGNGYLSINNLIMGLTSTINITGSGNCNIINGCNLGTQLTINNSGAIVVIQNCLSMAKAILISGILSIFQTVVYGSTRPSLSFSAITNSGGYLYLNNCDIIDEYTSAPGSISVTSPALYSLRNVTLNYASSTLTGSSISRNIYNDNIYQNGSVLLDANTTATLTNKTITGLKLTNNQLLTTTGNTITIPNITDTICNLTSAQTLQNKTLQGMSLNTNQFFINSGANTINIPSSNDTLVNLNSAQTLTSKTLTAPILSTNIIKTSTNNNINFIDSADTIVNLLSNQTISNKNMTNLTLGDDYFKTSLNRQVNIPNSNDTLVNLNSGQVMTNKELTDPKLTNNIIKSSTNKNITFIDSVDTLVNLNSIQTMTNKNIALTDGSSCITQATTDNTTKLATTAYVKNLLATPNSYVKTVNSSDAIALTTSYTDIMSITVDVAGTYEFNININCLTNGYISAILYNSTTSTEVANSFFQIVNVNLITGTIGVNGFKSLIIENIAAGTIYKVRALKTSAASGTGTIYNNATNGYSYVNFKMLGLTTNVPLTNNFGVIGTLPLTLSFNDYTLLYEAGAQSLKIKKASATTLTYGGLLTYQTFQYYYEAKTLTANTYTNIFFTNNSYPSIAGMNLNGTMTDETNIYNIQIICISASPFKFGISIQKIF